MRNLRTCALTAALAIALPALPAVGQPSPGLQGGSQASAVRTLPGTVAEVFGNNFLLQHEGVRFLVETGPPKAVRLSLKQGDAVTVTGRVDDRRIEATSIQQADGKEVRIRSEEGPPPWAGGDKGGGREQAARGDDRESERSEPRADRERGRRGQPMSWADAADLVDRVVQQGYTDVREIEVKPRHVEIEATDRQGRRVEIRAHSDGRIRVDD